MEHFKKNFSKPEQFINNGISLNSNFNYNGLKNYNNKISSDFKSKNSSSRDKLLIINQLMLNGKSSEAINLAEEELKKDKNNSNLYNAIGALLYNNNQKQEAEKKFQKALILDNKNSYAFCNLGKIYKDRKDIISALKCFKRAFSLNTNSKDLFTNLNNLLLQYGSEEYSDLWVESYELALSDKLYFSDTEMRFIHKNAFNLLMLSPLFKKIKDHILKKNELNQNFINMLIKFSNIKLYHICMESFVITNLKFEQFIQKLREYLLIHLKKIEPKIEISKLIQSIAIQNYMSEYLIYENENETFLIKDLENELDKLTEENSNTNFLNLLLLGSYRDLKKYKWINKINFPFDFLKLKEKFLTFPFIEEKYKKNIISLNQIENHISNQVKSQYEENPYPKWDKIPIFPKKISMKEYLSLKKINFIENKTTNNQKLEILVAGCGTGQEPINLSSYIENLNITAIDLSKTSLSYAIRKSKEYKIENINFYQCDLLNVKELNTKFDIIVCSGVLHHLDNPMQGWQKLTEVLNKKGLMKICLYSKIARRNIKPYQDKYSSKDIKDFNVEIREFRNKMIKSDPNFESFFGFRDFFNMSELRDLIFHCKEHQFTLPQIKSCLKELNLSFLGFDENYILKKNFLYNTFYNIFKSDKNILDLDKWDVVENSHKDIFKSMYRLWVQKI